MKIEDSFNVPDNTNVHPDKRKMSVLYLSLIHDDVMATAPIR
ncbi:hypothetical protein [Butyrivibrio sp. MB2005]|nr:hypothetical protein [Butyrivibrio sp. MB2005]